MIIDTASIPQPAKPRPVQRSVRRTLLAAVSWGYLVFVVAVWLLLREAGDRWWAATVLLLGPRWPLVVPLAGVWVWVLAARRWSLGIPALGATWVVLVLIMGFRVALPGGGGRGDIRLVTCNVHRQHLDADRLIAFLAEAAPDVVTLQGWSQTNHESLFTEGGWDVRRDGELFVASRVPIGEFRRLDLLDTPDTPKAELGAAALVELLTPRGPVALITLHLASPHGGLLAVTTDSGAMLADNVERRWAQSGRLRALADGIDAPVLLAGDFNTTDDSPIFRENWGDLSDAFTDAGTGFGYTYLNDHTQLRIDHVLCGPAHQFIGSWLGPDIGSPHRPLVADVICR